MSDFLVCENLEKVYSEDGKESRVLKSVSLTFERGSFTAVTGPSGAGKSTMLHIMGAIDGPTSGRVLFEGRDIHAMGERALAGFRNRKIGFIFQFYHLMPEFTVAENVMLPSLVAGAPKRKRPMELLDSVGLSGHAGNYCFELSGGEMQRVAICRALINEPELILADEPTGNLDSANSAHIIEILKDLSLNGGKTLIIATHDIKLAGEAGRIAMLADGSLTGIEDSREGGKNGSEIKKGDSSWV